MAAAARQRRPSQAPQRGGADAGVASPASNWWRIFCAIAYELRWVLPSHDHKSHQHSDPISISPLSIIFSRPFTPPTKHDIVNFVHSSRSTFTLLAEEGKQLSIHLHSLITHIKPYVTLNRLFYLTTFFLLHYLAVKIEFGLVFLILAALILICTVGLGDDAKSQGRLSAYSVFNRGMHRILGTINPEQFEAEYRNYALDGELADMVLRQGGPEGQEGENEDGDDAQQQPPLQQAKARKSGKKARRIFDKEERRRKRMGQGQPRPGQEWEEDWVSDGE